MAQEYGQSPYGWGMDPYMYTAKTYHLDATDPFAYAAPIGARNQVVQGAMDLLGPGGGYDLSMGSTYLPGLLQTIHSFGGLGRQGNVYGEDMGNDPLSQAYMSELGLGARTGDYLSNIGTINNLLNVLSNVYSLGGQIWGQQTGGVAAQQAGKLRARAGKAGALSGIPIVGGILSSLF